MAKISTRANVLHTITESSKRYLLKVANKQNSHSAKILFHHKLILCNCSRLSTIVYVTKIKGYEARAALMRISSFSHIRTGEGNQSGLSNATYTRLCKSAFRDFSG